MLPAYRALLRLYPRAHRELLGAEMQGVFEEGAREHRSRGWAAYLRFAAAELSGLAIGSATAWFARITSDRYLDIERHPAAIPAAAETLPEEVRESQNRVDLHLSQLVHAISHHQFAQARLYANQERKERENLRLLREKYSIPD